MFVTNFPAVQPVSGTVVVTQGTSPWVVDGSAVVQPVSGPLTDAELRATAVPVSVASLPLPDGAATEATLETLATEETLARAADSLDDVGLTAILEREKIEA